MNFIYLIQPPKKWTFEQPKLKQWIEQWCHGRTLNLFAGKIKLNIDEIRVDISNEFNPDYCGDAFTFVKNYGDNIKNLKKFNTIILDPPYNLRKAREKYDGKYIGLFTKVKNILPQILHNNGRIISLGYDSVGMSKSRGFKKIAICLICHNGDHNDTICLVEDKIE